ncbi:MULTISPECIES: hypothetical protein [unclassified Nocardioides]|uniref:hypothetical protein n=1 Tax=unclassified Nocardioides TaxID=2615069 RepID=UPI003014D6D9
MSDETLRELLEERVADLPPGRDLASGAWQAGVRARRRRRTTALAGVCGATAVAVALGVLAVTASPGDPPSQDPTAPAAPDAVVDGARVWWGPSLAEEARLPAVESRLPAELDLSAAEPDAVLPEAAVAAFGVIGDGGALDRVVVVGTDGVPVGVDVSRLGPATYPSGPSAATDAMLSPSGSTLVFPQPGAVQFLDLASGAWSNVVVDGGRETYPLTWVDDETVALPDGSSVGPAGCCSTADVVDPPVPGFLEEATALGPNLTSVAGVRARAFGYGAALPGRPGSVDDPETVLVEDGPERDVLAITSEPNDGRFLQCCPVAGWLDEDTVALESRSAEPRILAWDVGTHDLGLVTRIVGLASGRETFVGSYSRLQADPAPVEHDPGAGLPDARGADVDTWQAPTLAEEPDLPTVDGVLPIVVDVAAPAADAEEVPLPAAQLAVAVGPDRVLLVGGEERRTLDVSRVAEVRGDDGQPVERLHDRMLSPSGRYLAFLQRDHLLVFDVPGGRWRRLPLQERWGSGLDRIGWLRSDTVSGVGSYSGRSAGLTLPDLAPQMGPGLTWAPDGVTPYGVRLDGGELAQAYGDPSPEGGTVTVAPLQSRTQMLRIGGPSDPDRTSPCCPMVGFTADDQVLYESRDAGGVRLLRWRVGTGDVGVVTHVTGLPEGADHVASWASVALSCRAAALALAGGEC